MQIIFPISTSFALSLKPKGMGKIFSDDTDKILFIAALFANINQIQVKCHEWKVFLVGEVSFIKKKRLPFVRIFTRKISGRIIIANEIISTAL